MCLDLLLKIMLLSLKLDDSIWFSEEICEQELLRTPEGANAKDRKSPHWIPLHYAAEANNLDLIMALIAAGTQVERQPCEVKCKV